MATAVTPTDLVLEAQAALTAARAASAFLAEHPELPVQRMHASGPAELDLVAGPLLEIQLDNDLAALQLFARTVGAEIEEPSDVDYRVTVDLGGVTVWVTAWYSDDDDQPGFAGCGAPMAQEF